jgi:small-conductance mechanosensitive channel
MYPPMLPGRGHRPAEEGIDQERRLQELNRDYEGSPWLTALVVFSGFLVALVGTFDTLFLLGTALTGRTWWPYAVILAVLVGTHACLRAVRYGRRRARQSGTWDRRRVTRKRTEYARHT